MSRGLVNLEAYQLMWFSTEISCHHLISIQTEFNLNYEAESFLFPSPESCNKDVASGRKDCVLPLGINKNRLIKSPKTLTSLRPTPLYSDTAVIFSGSRDKCLTHTHTHTSSLCILNEGKDYSSTNTCAELLQNCAATPLQVKMILSTAMCVFGWV